jgi:hypothetical protein
MSERQRASHRLGAAAPVDHEVALVDLLDRLLAEGLVLVGDLTLAVADVELVHVSLRALITSITDTRQDDDVDFPRNGAAAAHRD